MLKKLFLLLFFIVSLPILAQEIPLSDSAEVSIITVGPGAELYDKFGHSAYRIKDKSQGFDIVYNYGTYDFDTPNFYLKFARGKLLYQLSEGNFSAFLRNYQAQNRWVKQQVLNLSQDEKQSLFDYLRWNAQPENAKYAYDFFFDNCATKIRDVLKGQLGEKLAYTDDFVTESYTFRELIQKNVHWNTWGSLGMDVALGAVVDRNATAWEYQFLPDYVFAAAAEAKLQENGSTIPLVNRTSTLFEQRPYDEEPSFLWSPLMIFGILALALLWITYKDHRQQKHRSWVDILVFLITGLVGVFLCFLWFGTEHSTTINNYDLLWAFPINLIIAFFVGHSTPKKWMYNYVFFLILMLLLLCIHWIVGVQTFAPALLPFLIALFIRYVYLALYLKGRREA